MVPKKRVFLLILPGVPNQFPRSSRFFLRLFIESNAGNKTSVVMSREPMQIVRSFPMLAIPRCEEKERVLKLKIVVKALKNKARAVLVFSMFPFGGGSFLKR